VRIQCPHCHADRVVVVEHDGYGALVEHHIPEAAATTTQAIVYSRPICYAEIHGQEAAVSVQELCPWSNAKVRLL